MSATADRAVNRTPARAICKGYTPALITFGAATLPLTRTARPVARTVHP